jgi:hypothetical protein
VTTDWIGSRLHPHLPVDLIIYLLVQRFRQSSFPRPWSVFQSFAPSVGMFNDKMELTGKDGNELLATVIYLPANGRS